MSTEAMFKTALGIMVLVFSSAWAQDTAYVPFRVYVDENIDVTATAQHGGVKVEASLRGSVSGVNRYVDTLVIIYGNDGQITDKEGVVIPVPVNPNKTPKSVIVHNSRGKISLELPQQYRSADIALYSLNGKQVLYGKATASERAKSISHPNVVMGVYLLSVKGTNGNVFATRLVHSGGGVNINATFVNGNFSYAPQLERPLLAEGDKLAITVSADGYKDTSYQLAPEVSRKSNGESNTPLQNITLHRANSSSSGSSSSGLSSSNVSGGSSTSFVPLEKKSFTETVGNVSFEMIYIPGGTFTLGCESGCAPGAAPAISGVKVSSYFIMKTEVSTALWNVVMGKSGGSSTTSYASATWYDAFEFACRLSNLTGHKYRIMTEAEFEYAAKNHRSSLEKIGDGSSINGEEWAYNSWEVDKHTGGTDPVGPSSGAHTQKTRRDANGTGESNVTSRLIRSIDGTGPSTRLVISADTDYPPNYVPSCDIHAPVLGAEPVNSYRDPRWVTGSDTQWGPGSLAIGGFDVGLWEDGTARWCTSFNYDASGQVTGCRTYTNGQWFTSNNFALVLVPSSGSITKYAYIFLDDKEGSLISEKGFMNGGYVGRIEKKAANVTKPTVSGLKSGEELAKAQTNFATEFKMVDMENIPTVDRKQDSRLLDGGDTKGWFQDNTSMNAAHHYRKDIDLDAFRFTVNQGNGRTVLAAGTWFTVNNTFLRVTHSNGYVADYLYTIADGTLYHNSFIGYERADFRMFEIKTNGSSFPSTSCGSICSQEIPKNVSPQRQTNDNSTYTPPKCPSGGCQ